MTSARLLTAVPLFLALYAMSGDIARAALSDDGPVISPAMGAIAFGLAAVAVVIWFFDWLGQHYDSFGEDE